MRADVSFVIEESTDPHPDRRSVEYVERKGRGHPDTICDALAEAFSISLSRAYHERFGAILHHNVDKVLLAAGSAIPRFGGGEVVAPIRIFLAGRATGEVGGTRIPVEELARESSRAWIAANLHGVDAARHVEIHTLVRPGARELVDLVSRQQASEVSLANDTSMAAGFAPASALERVVMAVEQALTGDSTTRAHPQIGEDVKVMGLRRGGQIALCVACAMIGRYLTGAAAYEEAKQLVVRLAEEAARQATSLEVQVAVNTADDPSAGRHYLTVTGTSAEAGDDGEAGRGNRPGGLIALSRPMTMESAAGKNVVAHVGKSYSIVAHEIARAVVTEIPEAAEATCVLVSRIGWPIDRPQLAHVQVRTHDGSPVAHIRAQVEAVARDRLARVTELWRLLLARASIEAPAVWPGVLLF